LHPALILLVLILWRIQSEVEQRRGKELVPPVLPTTGTLVGLMYPRLLSTILRETTEVQISAYSAICARHPNECTGHKWKCF
jgi:hypothetical protein